jgi:tol-pal system beta propeller repeat protein TolB
VYDCWTEYIDQLMMTRSTFLVGAAAFLALAPAMQGQNRIPVRPKPQGPIEVPPAVVVLQIDTTEGDSTRTIIQRDLDYGDRVQPLLLDSVTMADIWRPGDRRINYGPLAQTRANFVVRGSPTASGLHVEVFDMKGTLRQEAYFRLPRPPAKSLVTVKDSLSAVLAKRTRAVSAALAADSVARDTLARAAARSVPLKTPGQRVAARRAAEKRDSLSRELDRRAIVLRAALAQDTLRFDSVYTHIALRDSILRDSVEREMRYAIHGVSDEVERWLTGTRGIAATKIAYIDGTKLKIVDSDGANERTLPTVGAALSPSWHPSGRYIVYADADDRGTRIAQFDLRTMRTRLLTASTRGLNITPVYTKDGKNIVWASGGDSPAELMLASATEDDSSSRPFVGRSGFETTSPSFSPDGKQIVFMSPRPLTPQLYTMNVNGTGLRLLTPVVAGIRSYRTGADWSPSGSEIAFQQQNGDFQVWVIGVRDRVMRQLTSEGENEDPSWAPDGRHLAITRRLGEIGAPRHIWILDSRSGRLRQLTHGGDGRLSDWSPPLRPAF